MEDSSVAGKLRALLRYHRINVGRDESIPGSNFFGKTPLFFQYSGVNAANAVNLLKTPLTPLYRKGTPFTPLAFRLNAVNAVTPKKTCLQKNLNFSLHEEWEIHGQLFFWHGNRRLLEDISSKVWKNFRGLESGPERGGIGTVTELATTKQEYKKVDHFMTRLVGVFQKFWQF